MFEHNGRQSVADQPGATRRRSTLPILPLQARHDMAWSWPRVGVAEDLSGEPARRTTPMAERLEAKRLC